jgi:hypothetical protein
MLHCAEARSYRRAGGAWGGSETRKWRRKPLESLKMDSEITGPQSPRPKGRQTAADPPYRSRVRLARRALAR